MTQTDRIAVSNGPEPTLAEALRCYQAGEVDPWAGVILDAVELRIERAASRVMTVPGVIDEDDVRQQLAVEVLSVARTLRLDAEEWVPRMLMERALRNVRRWRRRQARLDLEELDDQLEAGASPNSRMMVSAFCRIGGRDDLEVLYDHHVLDEPYAVMARRLGVCESTLRSRASRAAERARQAVRRLQDDTTSLTCTAGGEKGE